MPVRHDPRTGKFMGGPSEQSSLRTRAPGKHVKLTSGMKVPKTSGVTRIGLGVFRKTHGDYQEGGLGFGSAARGQFSKSAPGLVASTHKAMGVVRRRHK